MYEYRLVYTLCVVAFSYLLAFILVYVVDKNPHKEFNWGSIVLVFGVLLNIYVCSEYIL